MKFEMPLEEPLDQNTSLIVPSAWLDSHGLVIAEIQTYNDCLIYGDTFRPAQGAARKRFIKELSNHVNLPEEVIDKALLKINANLTPMLASLPADDAQGGRPSQATQLVELAQDAELFHTPEGDAYATVEVNNHKETWRIKAKGFRLWLQRRFYEKTKTSANSQALQDALGALEGKALFEGPDKAVYSRLAEVNGKIYLDLTNEKWEVVEITPTGWQVVANPPVKFRRSRGMESLPHPIPGGSLNELRNFINVAGDEDWALLMAWLVQAIRPRGPYPLLVIHGEQGSAKSTLTRVLRSLVDPNKATIRSQPRDERDLMIAGTNGWIVALDNLSRLPVWLSDALCRLATGGGFATRELYSDADEVLFDVQRPAILNGIEELATRGDMLDRSILLYLPRIPDDKRRPEKEFWSDFTEARPRILGALCDAVSGAMSSLPGVDMDRLPRMADFAKWAVAAEKGLGVKEGTFIAAYTNNRQDANSLVLETAAVASESLEVREGKNQMDRQCNPTPWRVKYSA